MMEKVMVVLEVVGSFALGVIGVMIGGMAIGAGLGIMSVLISQTLVLINMDVSSAIVFYILLAGLIVKE